MFPADEAGGQYAVSSQQYSVDSQPWAARSQEPGARGQEEIRETELTDEEKLVLNLLKEHSPIDLNALKGQTGLSNKKWDLAIKGLRKHNLAKVEKTDAGLFVSMV